MNPINQLNRSDEFSLDDLVPIFDTSAGATRAVTGLAMQAALIPEMNSAIDAVLVWQRKTASFEVTQQYGSFDVFPSASGLIVKLPSTATYDRARIDIYNQSATAINITVQNSSNVTLKTLQPMTAFSFYYDNAQSITDWDVVQMDGISVISLPVATYGNFNAIEWGALPTGNYIIAGPGSQFSNLPTGEVLLLSSLYTYSVDHVNVPGNYSDNVFFTSNSDFTNNYLGRPCIRAGFDFGSATSVGWRIIGYKAEASYYLDVQSQSLSSVPLPTSATTYVWPTIVTEFGAASTYSPASGTITIPFTGVFTFNFTYSTVVASGSHSVFSGAKVFNGSTFVPSRYSARAVSVRNGETGQAIFTSTNRFTAGTQLRFDTWCDSGVNVQGITPVGGSADYTIPAARLLITGVETQ